MGDIPTGECGPYCNHKDQQLHQHKCRYCKKFIHLLCCWEAGIPEDESATNGDICIECWNKKPSADEKSTNKESAQKAKSAQKATIAVTLSRTKKKEKQVGPRKL